MFERQTDNENISFTQRSRDRLLKEFDTLTNQIEQATTDELRLQAYQDLTKHLSKIEKFVLTNELFFKYELEIKASGRVHFTLPAGTSYPQLFADCNEFSIGRWGQTAVHDSVTKRSSNYISGCHLPHEIIGLVPGSLGLTSMEQGNLVTSRKMLIPTFESAAAAAALYYCATGQDLFQGYWVRTSGDVCLVFDHKGVEADTQIRYWEQSKVTGCAGTPTLG
jgi:hypothetical protein